MAKKEISLEAIEKFLDGHNDQQRIVNLDYKYDWDYIKVFYRDENDSRCVEEYPFFPFVWAKLTVCTKLCNGNRNELKTLMSRYGIGVKELDITNLQGEQCDEMLDGYRYLFYAKRKMSYSDFLDFFKKTGYPIYSKDDSQKGSKYYLCVTPQEQFLISTGKRFFKGYEDYNELLRMIFDLETEGLDPTRHRIKLNGIRLNRPVQIKDRYFENFNKIFRVEGETDAEKNASELNVIEIMLKAIKYFKPDIITAHNGENFDWNFIIERCKALGTDIETLSRKYFNGEVIFKSKRESILKLGGEIEKFHQTVVPTIITTDSLHAVRRAQALDSNMKEANLKYVTIYSEMVKQNRVYVPGEFIDKTLVDTEKHFAFNNENGDWYMVDKNCGKEFVFDGNTKRKNIPVFNNVAEGYELVTGEYIVERYLYDDLWECDKVEHRYNTPNFLICKMLPVPFQKCCTMGTAGQWKALLLAWSYENNLAIPPFSERKSFTGGLSRLLYVGFVDKVAKFDYNSLYPSIDLTWHVSDKKDLMESMLAFLEHVLTQREKYKKLKKKAGKEAEKIKEKLQNHEYTTKEEAKKLNAEMLRLKGEESFNDKKQLPLKILGNSFFGSYGAPNVFPWGSTECAERTTCIGRQCLRLMIYYFNSHGYKPIVGDSFTPDTPLFIKYKDSGLIDIKPIEELIDVSSINIDALGREYDYSKKDYYILCRSGWVEPNYIYRHKTDKDIYEITEGDMSIEVTEDHSLFNDKQEKIKPSEIDENTKLEYYREKISPDCNLDCIKTIAKSLGKQVAENDTFDRVPIGILNSNKSTMKAFYDAFMKNYREDIEYSKTCLAGLQYIKRMT